METLGNSRQSAMKVKPNCKVKVEIFKNSDDCISQDFILIRILNMKILHLKYENPTS